MSEQQAGPVVAMNDLYLAIAERDGAEQLVRMRESEGGLPIIGSTAEDLATMLVYVLARSDLWGERVRVVRFRRAEVVETFEPEDDRE